MHIVGKLRRAVRLGYAQSAPDVVNKLMLDAAKEIKRLQKEMAEYEKLWAEVMRPSKP